MEQTDLEREIQERYKELFVRDEDTQQQGLVGFSNFERGLKRSNIALTALVFSLFIPSFCNKVSVCQKAYSAPGICCKISLQSN